MEKKRIFLSPPHMGGDELVFIREAFESNYIAPLGPQVDAFEREFAEYTGFRHCVALASGTAAMHLALRHLGVGPGDEIIASTLTFIGSITPVVFEGADLVFVDCDRSSWNMDVGLLAQELAVCAKGRKLPKVVVPTDLYGQCCDLPRIVEVSERYGVPVICDSAESLGGRYLAQRRKDAKKGDHEFHESYELEGAEKGKERKNTKNNGFLGGLGGLARGEDWKHAGRGARAAVYSFNGNKIITTSGGGMLASDDEGLIEHVKKLSQQAREDFPHYEHEEIGYNYRMSNVLAAIGRGQLRVLDERVERKREIFEYYKSALGDLPGIEFMPEPEWSRSNRWLTVVLITAELFGVDREEVRLALEGENIEARPVWKPMHVQPVFNPQITQITRINGRNKAQNTQNVPQITQIDADYTSSLKSKKKRYPCRVVGGEVAEDLFERGLCLPSGTAMENSDLDRVIEIIRKCYRR